MIAARATHHSDVETLGATESGDHVMKPSSRMPENSVSAAPAWVRLAAGIIQRLPAGRYRIMDWICLRPPQAFWMRTLEELGGYSFKCDLRDAICREVCFTGRYEPQETALARGILRPGMCFLDVGANWGYFTLLAAHLVGKGGRVISLEPDPRLFSILLDNLTRNELDQAIALPHAAADSQGVLLLAGYRESGGNFGVSRVIANQPFEDACFQVLSDSLDSVLDEQGIDSVDLMKMDIEGAEALAVKGMSKSLAKKKIKHLLLELHPQQLLDQGSCADAAVEILRAVDYTGFTINHSAPVTRRWAYGQELNLWSLLRPFDPAEDLDAWPHQLWIAPGSVRTWMV